MNIIDSLNSIIISYGLDTNEAVQLIECHKEMSENLMACGQALDDKQAQEMALIYIQALWPAKKISGDQIPKIANILTNK